jgi:phytoene/squalene synthetase
MEQAESVAPKPVRRITEDWTWDCGDSMHRYQKQSLARRQVERRTAALKSTTHYLEIRLGTIHGADHTANYIEQAEAVEALMLAHLHHAGLSTARGRRRKVALGSRHIPRWTRQVLAIRLRVPDHESKHV